MQIDLYTKAVLTVIAIFLSGIAIVLSSIAMKMPQQGAFRFAPSGALMVTPCDFLLRKSTDGKVLVTCSDGRKGNNQDFFLYSDTTR